MQQFSIQKSRSERLIISASLRSKSLKIALNLSFNPASEVRIIAEKSSKMFNNPVFSESHTRNVDSPTSKSAEYY